MESSDLRQELGYNFIEYAAAVNEDRSIPDATSGLKPVARRILYGALDGGRVSSKPHVKCARIVGDVMGGLHPHGSSSIYGAMVRLAQPWVMRYPLIDFHGNMGNIGGDGPAAERYTEARLSKLSEDGMLQGLKKKNVDFMPNYDESSMEPMTLPALFPNLLCNPNKGIGVALASSWLPHNLKEVANAIYMVMNGEEPTLPGPDFPTGGQVINAKDIPAIMKAGRGSVKIRGRYKVEKNKIVFYEIPYETTTEGLMKQIGELSDNEEIKGIKDIRDESSKRGFRLVIECDRGQNPEVMVQKLFQKTDLQTSVSYNQVALIDRTPTELNLKDTIEVYIKHNSNCIIKECDFDINKATKRLHIIVGLLKALDIIDELIEMIKKSASSNAAKDTLITKYGFSEEQAKAILDMKLSKLAKMEKEELEQEQKELEELLVKLQYITEHPVEELRKRLVALVDKYGDDRRTELLDIKIAATKEEKEIEAVTPEEVVVMLTKSGLVKRIPKKSFRAQNRNTKGVKNKDDEILTSFSTNTIDNLLLFSTKGQMYKVLVNNIPEGTNASRGVLVNSLIPKMGLDEKIAAATFMNRTDNKKFVVFITKQGMIKKTKIEEYAGVKKSGIVATKIKDGDELLDVKFMDEEELVLVSKAGKGIHFTTQDINPVGRAAAGVASMKLSTGDEIVSAIPASQEFITIVDVKGCGKKFKIADLPLQGRRGAGVQVCKNQVADAAGLNENDLVLIYGTPNNLCIEAKSIPTMNRIAIGNMLIKDSKVNSISVIKG